MTLFHFGNCVALAYFPYFIVYKCSGLSEYSAFWRCVKAGAAYLVTQLCKMLVLATFFPTSDVSAGHMDFIGEFLRSTVDFADLVGLHLVMTKVAGKGELKVLVAGVGWATAELVMTRLVPLWVGARGVEFDWKYIQMSFDANVSLIQHISTATLVWLWSRTDLQKSFLPIVMVFMSLTCYRPLLIDVLSHVLGIQSWSLLLLKTTFTSCIGIVALQLYLTLTAGKQIRT
ncbi:transmembrane protein 147-like [Stylophora pistillata]|uniref:BOS complex subunit TMEM147 n=1 Tax=Stylophora pistillata TaxID=50429 RepID=A0A2B4S9T4_STYPI|nr:transmembrane protein 147-like [Stylophora pistillata]PFX25793.1 Transmembrane protein 147 [Stylophora pistillata]